VHALLASFFVYWCCLLRLDSLADGATPTTSFIIGGFGVVVDAIICAIYFVLKIVLASAFDNHVIYSFLSEQTYMNWITRHIIGGAGGITVSLPLSATRESKSKPLFSATLRN